MNKSTVAGFSPGLLAQQASAAGFIEDSKATLKLRNFYINTDNRDAGTKSCRRAKQTKSGPLPG